MSISLYNVQKLWVQIALFHDIGNFEQKNYNYLDRKYAVIPNVVGKTVDDAMKELKSFKVEFSGSGDKIAYQSPIANSRIYEGETVRLLLTN